MRQPLQLDSAVSKSCWKSSPRQAGSCPGLASQWPGCCSEPGKGIGKPALGAEDRSLWRPCEVWIINVSTLQVRQKLREIKRWAWPGNGRVRPGRSSLQMLAFPCPSWSLQESPHSGPAPVFLLLHVHSHEEKVSRPCLDKHRLLAGHQVSPSPRGSV